MLDLTQAAKTFDDVCGWVTRAIARELTDEARLQAAMGKRYGWAQVKWEACATATEVARVLRLHGWEGRARACSPGCPVKPE